MAPVVGLMRPIPQVGPLFDSANHMLPSGPATIPTGSAPNDRPVVYWVMTPVVGLMRSIALLPYSVNHRLPSGPAAIPMGLFPGVMPLEYSVMAPVAGLRRPIWLASCSVNHRLPSGPFVIALGLLFAVSPEYSVITYWADAAEHKVNSNPALHR